MYLDEEKINSFLKELDKIEKFELSEDVPFLPQLVDTNKWNEIVYYLIEKGAIPKSQLVNGILYYGNSRNSEFAMWNKESNIFTYWRYKFGWIKEKCNHFEDDDGFTLFVPIREATIEEILIEESMKK